MYKRDMDLIRLLLIDLEGEEKTDLSKYDKDRIAYHYQLLIDAGFVKGEVHWILKRMSQEYTAGAISLQYITWQGHEFLDNARNEKVWRKALNTISEKVGSGSLQILTGLLQAYLQQEVGLS